MEHIKIAIIGAGPAGCAAALEAMSMGADNVVLFEKEELPRQKACAGGISSRTESILREMGLWDEFELKVQPVTSARLVFPSGRDFIVRGDETASVMNRREFDAFLQSKVVESGAEIRSSTIVREVIPVPEGVKMVVENKDADEKYDITASYVISAAGASSKFRYGTTNCENITTCTAWFNNLSFKPNEMELFFTQKLSPHYGWLFPESDSCCNIGLCVYTNKLKGKTVLEVYDEFLKDEFGARMDGAVLTEGRKIHPIRPVKKIKSEFPRRIIAVGDAAGLINPYTGEGISCALFSGRQAVSSILDGENKGWSWDEICSDYGHRINRQFAGKLLSGFFLCRTGPVLLSVASFVSRIPVFRPLLVKFMSKL